MNSFQPICRHALVVEDIVPTAQAVGLELELRLPCVKVDLAHTVADGIAFLEHSLSEDQTYELAILDFKLPPRKLGEHEELDFSIARQFSIRSPETVVVHITAYPDDPEIRSYLKHREEMTEAGRLFISKQGDWVKIMLDEIVSSLYTRRIRRQFDGLFRRRLDSVSKRVGSRLDRIGRSDRGRSLQVAALCSDAAQYWEVLSPLLQADLERVLGHSQDEKGNHYVGIVKPDTENEEGGEDEGLEL